MLRFILTRLVRVIPVLLLVTRAVTASLELIPGNPAEATLGRESTPETLQALEKQLGLNDALPIRYVKWLGRAVQFNLGKSMVGQESVNQAIKDRFPISLEIALVAQTFALLMAMIFGLWSAARSGSRLDRAVLAVTSAIQSMPSFCIAIVAIILFGVQRRWFPVTGWVRLTDDVVGNMKSVFMPAMSLALVEAAAYIRVLRGDVVRTLREDFVLGARAKGLPDRQILLRHALRPSSFGLVTIAGITLARLIGGTIVIEGIFEIPGLGNKIIRALSTRDYTMIQGLAAFLAVVYVLLSVSVEVLYAMLDPRVRARVRAS